MANSWFIAKKVTKTIHYDKNNDINHIWNDWNHVRNDKYHDKHDFSWQDLIVLLNDTICDFSQIRLKLTNKTYYLWFILFQTGNLRWSLSILGVLFTKGMQKMEFPTLMTMIYTAEFVIFLGFQ